MPTGKESVENRPLTGIELKQILIKDFENLLNRDAMFSQRLSYPQASYRIKLQLFLPIPGYPEHILRVESAEPPKNPPHNEEESKKKALTAPPKNQLSTVGMQRDRTLDSPNLARLTHNLPITINRRNPESGRIEEIPVHYEAQDAGANYPELNRHVDRDITSETWS